MKTHYVTPKHISFEIKRCMKISCAALNEQTITGGVFYIYIS